jgi:hypothetical protein
MGARGSLTGDDSLEWLEGWYESQCNGVWEHRQGIRLETLDNPGWLLTVDLNGTEFARDSDLAEQIICLTGDPPSAANGNRGTAPWLDCRVRDGRFVGAGSQGQLRRLLETFRAWAGASAAKGEG